MSADNRVLGRVGRVDRMKLSSIVNGLDRVTGGAGEGQGKVPGPSRVIRASLIQIRRPDGGVLCRLAVQFEVSVAHDPNLSGSRARRASRTAFDFSQPEQRPLVLRYPPECVAYDGRRLSLAGACYVFRHGIVWRLLPPPFRSPLSPN